MHMPMGYKISDGKITVDEEKADIIKRVFESFIAGKSMLKISQELTESAVANANGKPSWNHCSVGNILKNIKYTGDEYHPAIISEDSYRTAERLRTERARQLNHGNNYIANSNKGVYPFSGKLICGECGAIFKRYTEHHNANKKCNWKCKRYIVNNRVCCKSAVIDDAQLEQAFIDVANKVLKEPKLIDMRSRNKELTAQLMDKFGEEAAQPSIIKYSDIEERVRLLFRKAAEVYINCSVDDFKYQTDKLKKMFGKLTSVRAFDNGLFLESVRHVTVYASGVLRFEFINGATAETTFASRKKAINHKKGGVDNA